MPANLPDDPMTPSAEAFVAMHQMYKEMRAAGFTLLEAAAILGATLNAGNKSDDQ